MADYTYRQGGGKTYNMDANAALTIHLAKWLTFKTAYSYRGEHYRYKRHMPAYVADVKAKQDYPSQYELLGRPGDR